jgi:hypothetical protein
MARRPVRSAVWWRTAIERQAASGLSRKAFCEREGIGRSSFEKWRGRLASESSAPAFVEVRPAVSPAAGWDVELALPGGIVLRLRG